MFRCTPRASWMVLPAVPCRFTQVRGYAHCHLLCGLRLQWGDPLCYGGHGRTRYHLPGMGELICSTVEPTLRINYNFYTMGTHYVPLLSSTTLSIPGHMSFVERGLTCNYTTYLFCTDSHRWVSSLMCWRKRHLCVWMPTSQRQPSSLCVTYAGELGCQVGALHLGTRWVPCVQCVLIASGHTLGS